MRSNVVLRDVFRGFTCIAAVTGAIANAAYGNAPPPAGALVYLHDGKIVVDSAGEAGNGARVIPRSDGAFLFSASPKGDGTIVFFAPRTNSHGPAGASGPDMGTYLSRPPYKDSDAVPLYVGKDDDTVVTWAANGDAEISVGDLRTRRIDVRTGKMSVEPEDASTGKATKHHSGTGAGSVSVYTDGDNRVMMTKTPGGPETMLFSPKSPDVMLNAVRHAHNPANLKQLSEEVDVELWKEPRNWSISNPALNANKTTAFFASNLGTGMGAQGNTFFCLFASDLTTGKLAVLSKAGTFFGRVPTDSEVSPDDNRLFFTTSAHNSAADNSFSGYAIDLETQTTREIIRSDPAHAKDANLTAGWCWSPDGHYLAIAVLYYDTSSVRDSDPDMKRATLYIKDAATGRIVRQIPHAQMPAWMK